MTAYLNFRTWFPPLIFSSTWGVSTRHSARGFRAETLKDQTTAMLRGILFQISSFRNRPSLHITEIYDTAHQISSLIEWDIGHLRQKGIEHEASPANYTKGSPSDS
jgi:hypothetical protein